MKHPSQPQLPASAHAPPGHPVRWSGGAQGSPRLRTASPPPQHPPRQQSHLLPVALANAAAAAASNQEHPLGQSPQAPQPVIQVQQAPASVMAQVQQVQMQVQQVQQQHLQMPKQRKQMMQSLQMHPATGPSTAPNTAPNTVQLSPTLLDPLQTQPLDASSVIRKPSSDITQVPSRRV
eukprot:Skav235630  [mRNA]  locus=scaffold358:365404:365937:- [translate_table: standard]